MARRREGQTQQDAAKKLGMNLQAYGQLERATGKPIPPLDPPLQPHERCMLYRRRLDRTQKQVAEELPCSRWWLVLMERGEVACDDLLWYWEQ